MTSNLIALHGFTCNVRCDMILLLWLLIWRPIQRTYRRRVRRDDKSVLVGIFFLFSISPHDRSHCTPCRLSVPSCRCCCCGSWLVVFLVLFEFLPLASRKTNATESFPNTWRGGIVDPSASSSSFFFFTSIYFFPSTSSLAFARRWPTKSNPAARWNASNVCGGT